MNPVQSSAQTKLYRLTILAIGVLTIVRILVLVLSRLELYPDEAQYWWWAQTPDLGYFSKPPLIAWIIWATTHLFGDGEWAVRLASPLLHGGTALVLMAIGRRLFSERVGAWSGIAYATLPGVSYSAGMISTDVPLLFFWAVALYALIRAADDDRWRWSLLCGLALGLGLLSKYAMLFFLPGIGLSLYFVPRIRQAFLGVRGLAILAIGLLLLYPNLLWNAAHGFPTIAHTESNANWRHGRFEPLDAIIFAAGQFGVFGPLMMSALVLRFARAMRARRWAENDLLLVCFCAPVLVIMLVQAAISDANANWAATAYIAATPLAVAELLAWWNGNTLRLSVGLHVVLMLVLWLILIAPGLADRIGMGNAFKRLEGWGAIGSAVVDESRQGSFEAIVAANRSLIAELLYYGRDRILPLKMWDRGLVAKDHFQMTMRLERASRVLLVLLSGEERQVVPSFGSVRILKTVVIPVGGHRQRVIQFYDARDYRGPRPHA